VVEIPCGFKSRPAHQPFLSLQKVTAFPQTAPKLLEVQDHQRRRFREPATIHTRESPAAGNALYFSANWMLLRNAYASAVPSGVPPVALRCVVMNLTSSPGSCGSMHSRLSSSVAIWSDTGLGVLA
jgi:hypothetical protein